MTVGNLMNVLNWRFEATLTSTHDTVINPYTVVFTRRPAHRFKPRPTCEPHTRIKGALVWIQMKFRKAVLLIPDTWKVCMFHYADINKASRLKCNRTLRKANVTTISQQNIGLAWRRVIALQEIQILLLCKTTRTK